MSKKSNGSGGGGGGGSSKKKQKKGKGKRKKERKTDDVELEGMAEEVAQLVYNGEMLIAMGQLEEGVRSLNAAKSMIEQQNEEDKERNGVGCGHETVTRLGAAFAEAGCQETAIQVLIMAIERSPVDDDGHEKYMYLGQLLEVRPHLTSRAS